MLEDQFEGYFTKANVFWTEQDYAKIPDEVKKDEGFPSIDLYEELRVVHRKLREFVKKVAP
jgi:hypothetical protein